MKKSLRIAVSGKSGCGNSTTCRLLGQRINYRVVNYTFHNMAVEKNIGFEELCMLAEKNSQYDLNLDQKQIELTRKGGCILGSRLAIWLLQDADLKVYLDAPIDVRACRVGSREDMPFESAYERTKGRDIRDHERFLKLYNIDNDSFSFVDLIIDSSKHTPDQIVELIVERLKTL